MNNKKFILAAFAFSLLLIGGVSAFFYATGTKSNAFTIGYVETQIEEDYDPPSKLEPGVSFKKDVKINNTGKNDCYIRVLVEFSDSQMGNLCILDYNTNAWTYNDDDGYWYYNQKLKAGESTESLFTNVKISEDADPADFEDFDILIYHESSNKRF